MSGSSARQSGVGGFGALGAMMAALSGCGAGAEFSCAFDDPAAGDVYATEAMACAEYRESGEQVLASRQADCEEEAAAAGAAPATCTCEWLRECSGPAND